MIFFTNFDKADNFCSFLHTKTRLKSSSGERGGGGWVTFYICKGFTESNIYIDSVECHPICLRILLLLSVYAKVLQKVIFI